MTVIPSVLDFDTENSSSPVKSKINLGLDLQGGLYMVLGIDFNKVFADEVKKSVVNIQKALKDNEEIDTEFGKKTINDPNDPRQALTIKGATDMAEVKTRIKEFVGPGLRLTGEDGRTLEYGIGREKKLQIETNAVKKIN